MSKEEIDTATYQYQRLQATPHTALGEIRLVELLPGEPKEPISVSITAYPLDSLSATPSTNTNTRRINWIALSYTWGDLDDRENVLVYDSDDENEPLRSRSGLGSISVTKNLTEALRHLRDVNETRIFWIDAISIDQSSSPLALEERAAQVRSMHHIFARAVAVIIWLGPEADDSAFALQSLSELGSSMRLDWKKLEIYTEDGVPSGPMAHWDDRSRSARDRKAVGSLLERPWFDRVWIRQEAFFANEETTGVFCGDSFVSFAAFRKAINYLSRVGLGSELHQSRLSLALSICERERTDTPNLMRRIRMSQCRDQRDRIYGILGIVELHTSTARPIPVRVDYSESNTPERAYMDFFLRSIQTNGTLRLLEEAGLWQSAHMRPTWVPDWREDVLGHQFDLSMESATSHFLEANSVCIDNTVLRVHGVAVGQFLAVHSFQHTTTPGPIWDPLATLLTTWFPLVPHHVISERCSRVLSCILNPLRTPLTELSQRADSFIPYITHILESATTFTPSLAPSQILPQNAAWAINVAATYLQSQPVQLVCFDSQYLGLCPGGALPGDRVFAVLGSRALIVLRPLADETYNVVGPCFIHGFNWGEALLGPLPDKITVVPRDVSGKSGSVPYYVNAETGEETSWDPRISWDELRAHPPMVEFAALFSPEGELRVRPGLEYLRRHNIDIAEIDLV